MVAPPPRELWSVSQHWRRFADGIRADIAGFDPAGLRTRRAVACGVAVALGVLCAIILDLDFPMWSGISAFICVQSSLAATALKGVLRILGTIGGGLLAAFVVGIVGDNHVALFVALLVSVSYALYRSYLSRYTYAWLLSGITIGLVMLTSIAEPAAGLEAAAYRVSEVVVGVIAAWIVVALLLPEHLDPRTDHALMDTPKLQSRRHAAATEGGRQAAWLRP
jgi:uncharacterized membrane protein YccC